MSGVFSSALSRLLDSPGSSRKGGPKADPTYTQALEAFWQKKHQLAIGLLADRIAQDVDAPISAPLYRLWIEICAETRDKASLQTLRNHLFVMGQEKPDDHVTFFALRGLIHFELDEIEAANVLAQACESFRRNLYVLELHQRLALRTRPSGGLNEDEELRCLALVSSKEGLRDYCHWYQVIQGLAIVGQEEFLGLVLEHVGQLYPRSPVPHLFEFHRSLEQGYFAAAATVAERLRELAPQVIDYMYFQAYAYFEDGDYPSARKILHEANHITGGFDAEIIGLLGHCHAKLGGAAEAAECLRKSMGLLTKEGLPASHVALEYLDVEQEMNGNQSKADTSEMPREPQGWVVHLSSRRLNELLTSPENVTERLLRPMGTRAMPGDLCFLAGESGSGSKWHIHAVYAIESEPLWHPLQGHQSVLKRVITFPQAIIIDLARMPRESEELLWEQDKDQTLRHSWSEIDRLARLFGVHSKRVPHAFGRGMMAARGFFQLDADALMIVEQKISQQRDAMVERRKSLQSRRPTA